MAIVGDLGLSIRAFDRLTHIGLIGDNLILNPGFEDATAHDFDSWTEDTDTGNATITQDASFHGGAASCKILSNVGGDVGGNVNQNFSVEAGESYQLSFWSKTSDDFSSMQGRFSVYDVTNSDWIVPRTEAYIFSQSEWTEAIHFFNIPTGCVTATLYLYQNYDSGSSVFYDDVEIRKRQKNDIGITPIWGELGDVSSYRHTISARNGYDTMTFTTAGDEGFVGDWLESGLFRHVVVTEPAAKIVWEGFVNQISITVGGLSISAGPIMDVINKGRISYRTLDINTNPPIAGESTKTPWSNSDLSQERFGVLEGVISGGEGTLSENVQLLATVLEEIAWPDISQSFNLIAAPSLTVTINCLGYIHLLDKYYFSNTAISGEYDLSDKIKEVLSNEPNNIISAESAVIEANTTQVPRYDNNDKTALVIIRDLAALGDEEFNKYIYGVYADRIFKYELVEDNITYVQRLSDGLIESVAGGEIKPWDVVPGRWMALSDFMVGRPSVAANFRQDPRHVFIESVTYVAPYSVTVTGGKVTTFKQRLDRLGLGGL
jgi:hypothetical protein